MDISVLAGANAAIRRPEKLARERTGGVWQSSTLADEVAALGDKR
jgi:hypothetical protein